MKLISKYHITQQPIILPTESSIIVVVNIQNNELLIKTNCANQKSKIFLELLAAVITSGWVQKYLDYFVKNGHFDLFKSITWQPPTSSPPKKLALPVHCQKEQMLLTGDQKSTLSDRPLPTQTFARALSAYGIRYRT